MSNNGARSPFQNIAKDIGVFQYKGESDKQYRQRTAYSAARFVVSAFCQDDGQNGAAGISKQALSRRISRWALNLDALEPGIRSWFEHDNGIQSLYCRLINVGEIQSIDYGEHYRSTRPHTLHIAPACDLIVGFYDASNDNISVCNSPLRQLTVSGLTTLSPSDNLVEPEPTRRNFLHLENRRWTATIPIGNLEFHCPHQYGWGIRNESGWRASPKWSEGLALARNVLGNGTVDYYVAKRTRTGIDCSPILTSEAKLLSILLQKEQGAPVHIAYNVLDSRHVCFPLLPFGYLQGECERIVEALTWPIDNASGNNSRIARSEALPALKTILEASNFSLEERNGSNPKR